MDDMVGLGEPKIIAKKLEVKRCSPQRTYNIFCIKIITTDLIKEFNKRLMANFN